MDFQSVGEIDSLNSLFANVLQSLGFCSWAYQASVLTDGKPVIFSNYPEDWVKHYVDMNYHLIDPVVKRSVGQKNCFLWSSLIGEDLSGKQKTLFREASDYHLDDGIGIPLGNNGTISLVSEMPSYELKKYFAAKQQVLLNLAKLYHQTAEKHLRMVALRKVAMTKRELECLQLAAAGLSDKEIAQHLKITYRTVNIHMEHIRDKLSADNKIKAIVKATAQGLIQLSS